MNYAQAAETKIDGFFRIAQACGTNIVAIIGDTTDNNDASADNISVTANASPLPQKITVLFQAGSDAPDFARGYRW